MLSDNLPKCPFCNNKLSYINSFIIHKKGQYYCKHCGNVSTIEYTKKFKRFSVTLSVVAIALCLIFSIIGKVNIFEVILVIIPFLILYFFMPYFIILTEKSFNIKNDDDEHLREYKIKSKSSKRINSKNYDSTRDFNDIEITKILDLKK